MNALRFSIFLTRPCSFSFTDSATTIDRESFFFYHRYIYIYIYRWIDRYILENVEKKYFGLYAIHPYEKNHFVPFMRENRIPPRILCSRSTCSVDVRKSDMAWLLKLEILARDRRPRPSSSSIQSAQRPECVSTSPIHRWGRPRLKRILVKRTRGLRI